MAHLRAVRLRGFKTFARPTELTFEPGVTVIIGPNGSGKSNLADAVLWVLGEQSPGNLRGRTMTDVVFSGAGGRKSSAVAEVSLVFDNGSGSLPLDCSELEVTRRLDREAGSEYRLNGSECRLLDVQDVVGALGLGREMHSVVSQGKVDALLNSTPEARRAMVEEAAGLGRFKKRRERAQVKLDRTGQNLLRVADIEAEVKAALRPLRQQVVAAERFADATEEWAAAVARSLLRTMVETDEARLEVERGLAATQAGLRDVSDRMDELRERRTHEERRLAAALTERERLSDTYHKVHVAAEHLSGRAGALRQRLARMEGELDRARRRRDFARSEVASLSERLQDAASATSDEGRLARVGSWSESLREALQVALPEYRDVAAAEDDLKDSVFELEAARSRAVQDREFLRRQVEERQRLSAELARLIDEAQVRLRGLEEEAASQGARIAAAERALQEAAAAVEQATEAREAARARVERAGQADAAIGEALAGVESRRMVLADVLERREGLPVGARRLLEANATRRLLTDALAVTVGYERAFAAALGLLSQAVVLPSGDDLAAVLGTDGAVEVVSEAEGLLSAGPELRPPEGTRDLWEVVSGPEALVQSLRALVPPTAVVIDEAGLGGDARAGVWNKYEGPWRLVDRSGLLLEGGIHAARRRESGVEALLAARNELKTVSLEHEELVRRRAEAREEVDEAAAEAASSEQNARACEERLRQAERELAAYRGEADLQGRRVEEAAAQYAELRDRSQRESGLLEQVRADLREVDQGLVAKEVVLEEARASLRALQNRLETIRATVRTLEEKKTRASLIEVKLRERCRAQASERSRMEAGQRAAALEVDRSDRRVKALEQYIPEVGALLAVVERLAERSARLAAGLRDRLESKRADAEGTTLTMQDWGSAESALQRDYDDLAERLTQLRVDEARLQDRQTQLDEELAELRRRHLSPRSLTRADVAGEDAQALAAAVERAERRRERIGPINPLAEQECAEMEERARFLAEQREDLEASVAQLREVIAELDEHIDRSFAEVFEATREHFSAVIASVFPGAKGSLKLTGQAERNRGGRPVVSEEGAPLEDGQDEDEGPKAPGIALEVKFPNKAPRSLSLLSGGEKAMTAIAFLFALFLARPCPFYILDEVEASLDDVNIRRFLSLVRKYRDRTQFIIITHQRQTMEVADTLYGVALESDGTSRVLSRRLTAMKGA
jgi:chromosome segregation protein